MSGRRSIESPHAAPLLIVCAYPEGTLAGSWFRAYQRVRRTVERAAFKARVELAPITELPSRLDVLIVPPSLASAADAAAGVKDRLVVAPADLQREFDRLVERLVRDGRLHHAPSPNPAVAVHRGFRPLAERGRLPG